MYWGQITAGIAGAFAIAFWLEIRGHGPVVFFIAAILTYLGIRWAIAWYVRVQYWVQRGGQQRRRCAGCGQRIRRLAGDWVLTCHRCGWRAGWPGVRWLTQSVPSRQLVRTVTGPRLVVAVVAAAVLLGAVVPAVPAVVSEDGEEFVDVIQGVGTVDVDGGERDDDTAGELSAESDANGSSDSPGEPSRVGDGRVIFEDGETGSSEYVRSVRAYRNGTLEVTLHPDHDTDGFSVMHEYHSDPGEDALFLGENPSFAGPIRVPMLDYVLDEAYPTGTFRLEIREGVTGGEWHLPTLVVRDDVVESITFTIPETWQHANELVDDEFSVYGYTPTDLDGNAVARHVAEEINDRREAEGLGALESHADIAGAADAVAETWARRDNAPGGGVYRPSPSEVEIESQDCASPVLATAVRVDRPAITPDGAAQLETPEDVAAAVVDIWMVKPETRSRLLRERLQSHGVGVDVQNGKVYVTHLRCESLRYSL